MNKGVSPFPFLASRLARYCARQLTIRGEPCSAAIINGVAPISSRASTSAPRSSKKQVSRSFPWAQARCSGLTCHAGRRQRIPVAVEGKRLSEFASADEAVNCFSVPERGLDVQFAWVILRARDCRTQEGHNSRVALLQSDVQRRFASMSCHTWVCADAEKIAHHLRVAFPGGFVQGRHALFVLAIPVDVCLEVQEQLSNPHVVRSGGCAERAAVVVVWLIRIGSMLEQLAHDFVVAAFAGDVQTAAAVGLAGGPDVDVAVVQQLGNNSLPTVERGPPQRSPPVSVGQERVRRTIQKKLHNVVVPGLCGKRKRCLAMAIDSVDIRLRARSVQGRRAAEVPKVHVLALAVLQEHFRYAVVASASCLVQRSVREARRDARASLCDEDLGDVRVIETTRHMQRRPLLLIGGLDVIPVALQQGLHLLSVSENALEMQLCESWARARPRQPASKATHDRAVAVLRRKSVGPLPVAIQDFLPSPAR
eukprot:scaffold11_cov257-Pinguiococcus_pyrenoidosus.AAC.29